MSVLFKRGVSFPFQSIVSILYELSILWLLFQVTRMSQMPRYECTGHVARCHGNCQGQGQ